MGRARQTGGWAVLCANRMDGELEDPGRQQRRGRTRLYRCEHGQAKLRDGL